jgi:hypothetical protein
MGWFLGTVGLLLIASIFSWKSGFRSGRFEGLVEGRKRYEGKPVTFYELRKGTYEIVHRYECSNSWGQPLFWIRGENFAGLLGDFSKDDVLNLESATRFRKEDDGIVFLPSGVHRDLGLTVYFSMPRI